MFARTAKLVLVLLFGIASALSGADLSWCLCERQVVLHENCCGCPDAGADVGEECGQERDHPGVHGRDCCGELPCTVSLFEGEVVAQDLVRGSSWEGSPALPAAFTLPGVSGLDAPSLAPLPPAFVRGFLTPGGYGSVATYVRLRVLRI